MPTIILKKLDTNPQDPILNSIVSSWTYNPTDSRVMERIKRHLEEQNLYIAEEGKKLVGAIAFSLAGSGKAEITGLGVLMAFRGRGLGRAIVEQAAAELFGTQDIYLETDDSAVSFYRKCGFSIAGTKALENGITRYSLFR